MSEFAIKSVFATLPFTERGMPIVISGDPKGKNFLYANGNSVLIRDIANPSICDVYTEHSTRVRAARYSPSGFYIASADSGGKVRIWDTTNKEHILKNEYQPIGGAIRDVAWDGESKRIVVGGEGRDKFGHVFAADAGNSLGDIMGQSKAINSVDFKPTRPFRIVTASEDSSVAFFAGPPFKFQCTKTNHSKFVNAVRYSPDGTYFVTAGADCKSFVFDGTSGEMKTELGSPAHKGGVYAVCPSPDSRRVLSVSGDKTAKIWDVETSSVVSEFTMGSAIQDMQVGCLWQGEYLLTVSLSGHINYLDVNNPAKPIRILKGHNKPITAMGVTRDGQNIYTGASDGQICCWDSISGDSEMVTGKGHSNQIQHLAFTDDSMVTCGMDDTVVYTSLHNKQYTESVKMPSQPRGIAARGDLVIVACINDVVVLRDKAPVFMQKAAFEPQCVAIHPGLTEVAVGGMDPSDQKVHVYELNNDTLSEKRALAHDGGVMDVSYSPDGAHLAAVDTYRKVYLYKLPEYENKVGVAWSIHTAKINTVAWTPNSRHLATGSLDTNVIVWNPEKPMKRVNIKAAHPMSQITRVQWIDDNTMASSGHDSCLRIWTVNHE